MPVLHSIISTQQ